MEEGGGTAENDLIVPPTTVLVIFPAAALAFGGVVSFPCRIQEKFFSKTRGCGGDPTVEERFLV